MRRRALLSCIPLLLAVIPSHAAPASSTDNFTLSNPSGIPGTTLQPGTYSIHVLNRLSDRVILKVDGVNTNVHQTFIGIQDKDIAKPSRSGLVMWSNSAGQTNYLKGWYFPGTHSVIEFVYPKSEAVSIATANPARVPAVDPASEGKVTDNTLSKEDMQVLSLWLLSLQQVGPGVPTAGIKAERYHLASAVSYRPAIKVLPHTASQVPLVWLSSLCMLFAAGYIRWVLPWVQSQRTILKPSRQG